MTPEATTRDPALLRCPFCGGKARVVEGGERYYATCTKRRCFAAIGECYDRDAMPEHMFGSEAEAVAAWNRRAPQCDHGVLLTQPCNIAPCASSPPSQAGAATQGQEGLPPKQAKAPTVTDLLDTIEGALADASLALPVLGTMLSKAAGRNGKPLDLRAGVQVADEMIGNVKFALNAFPALRAALRASTPGPGWKLLKDTTQDERSWSDDFCHENGHYYTVCCHCLRTFIGHKRRVTCRVCAAPSHPGQQEGGE